jgi:hypothetical protein
MVSLMAGDRPIERLAYILRTAALLAFAGMIAGGALARASPRPDLVEMAVLVSKPTVPTGASLRVTDTARNRGLAAAPRLTIGYYLSRDRTPGLGDLRFGGRSIGGLPVRASSRGSALVRIPRSTLPGSYRILACADDRHRVRESEERNNCHPTTTALVVTKPLGSDHTLPTFAGLKSAATCIPGPVEEGRSASYQLKWDPATDKATPASKIVYDVYQARTGGGENFSTPTYTTEAGASSFTPPPLPADKTYYFVVRARDRAGNPDLNRIERPGVNLCL